MKKVFYLLLFILGIFLILSSATGIGQHILYEISTAISYTFKEFINITGIDYIIETFKEFI